MNNDSNGMSSTGKRYAFIGAIALVAALIIAALAFIPQGARNGAITRENMIARERANVETIVQKRVDSLTEMINTVKESERFEGSTITALTQARSRAATGDIAGSGTVLQATAEAYPELKTIDLFAQVNDQTVTVENQLANTRQAYNTAVRDYENSTQTFPNSILLKLAGYSPKTYQLFSATKSAQNYDPTTANLWK